MPTIQRFILVSLLTSISYAGVIEKRQAAETFLTCRTAPNPTCCPDPYCVCTQPVTQTSSNFTTTYSVVNVYAATSGAVPCPTPGAAVSEAGCQIDVVSKTDSTCGPVIFNKDFCHPSSTASINSGSTSAQVSSASQTQQIKSTTASLNSGPTPTQVSSTLLDPPRKIQPTSVRLAPASSITAGPSYDIVGAGQLCVINGVTQAPNLTPLQTCGSLTAPFNCYTYDVLPWSAAEPKDATFTGCACNGDSFERPGYSTVQIAQSGQTSCNPSESSYGPWAEILTVYSPTFWVDLLPNCEKWLRDNMANPTPEYNPCSGFRYLTTPTASCEYITQVDGLGQDDDMCTCSNKNPKYTTNWFGVCPSSSYVDFTATITVG